MTKHRNINTYVCLLHYVSGGVKGIVKEISHPQAIQDVDEVVSSLQQVWRNLALNHLLTNGSSAVNGCCQNESPNG